MNCPRCDLPKTTWPELDNLCIDCFRDGPLAIAWQKYCLLEDEWIKLRDRLFWVEVATRQRDSAPRSGQVGEYTASQMPYPRNTVTKGATIMSPGRRKPAQFHKNEINQPDDDLGSM